MEKSPEAFRTIREVAEAMDLPQHVLRFWETRFPQIRPLKRAGGRRYYRPDDVERLKLIRRLLYDEGYTIKGVQKLFKEQGVQNLATPASIRGCLSSRLKRLRPPRRRTFRRRPSPRRVRTAARRRAGSADGASRAAPVGRTNSPRCARVLADIREAQRILGQARPQPA